MEFNKSLIQSTRRTSSITKEVAKAVPVTYKDFRRSTHTRLSPHRKKTARIVFKSGLFNIEKSKPHSYHVFPDIVTTFIEARWRCTVLYCILTSVLSWLAFAGAWWTLLYLHGDFEDEHLPDNNSTWVPCVKQIYGFTSTFLFSIEIHTTIGYGTRALTLECPVAIVLMCIEGILGTLMQSFIIGVVFAKLTRPKNRAQTLLFSKHALINQRDRRLSLIFRVGNIRKSRIIAVSVHAYLIRYHTKSGDVLKNEQIKLDLLVDACDDIIFMFPITVVHKIDERSPLYDMSAEDLLRSKIEILVVLEGTIESTGQPVQLRSSYTSKEILWGHRFVHLLRFRQDRQGHELDYSNFENTIQVNTPLCSARQLDDFYSHTRNGLKSSRVSCPKCHCDRSHS